MDVATIIREARVTAGLTQAELARRAGTSQPAVAAYEAGTRSPSVDTLDRLLAAAGQRAELRLSPRPTADLSGPVGSLLRENQREVRAILRRHGARRPRVFGSVARGEDERGSDLDLVIDTSSEFSLLDQAAIALELRELLGIDVDVLTEGALAGDMARRVAEDGVPL